jgi:hypothetical protein
MTRRHLQNSLLRFALLFVRLLVLGCITVGVQTVGTGKIQFGGGSYQYLLYSTVRDLLQHTSWCSPAVVAIVSGFLLYGFLVRFPTVMKSAAIMRCVLYPVSLELRAGKTRTNLNSTMYSGSICNKNIIITIRRSLTD